MTNTKPIIGIILDWQEKGSFSIHQHYALRTQYFDAVEKAGGLPIGIPFSEDLISDFLNKIDGLLVPGALMASPESWYMKSDEEIIHPKSERSNFEYEFIKQAIAIDMPYLGICQGMQDLCGVFGGKICKNLHTHYDTNINHLNDKRTEPVHNINITKDSILYNIIGKTEIAINSDHTEAIVKVPHDIKVTATSPDGVIEAIEMPSKKFVLGIQWHPEYLIGETLEKSPDFKIFKSFIEVCNDK